MRYGFEKFEEYIKGKSVALIGAGVSNMAAVELLSSLGARITVRDKKEDAEKQAALREKGADTVFGENYLEGLCEDVLLKSPGIRPDVPEIAAAVARGAAYSPSFLRPHRNGHRNRNGVRYSPVRYLRTQSRIC